MLSVRPFRCRGCAGHCSPRKLDPAGRRRGSGSWIIAVAASDRYREPAGTPRL